MSNLNASQQNYTHLSYDVSVKEPQNFVRKCYLVTKLLTFKI